MPSLKVRISDTGHTLTDVLIEAETALLGSGGHCDIRLGSDLLAPEQLFLAARADGLFAEARAASPTVFVAGMPLSAGTFQPRTTFTLGRLVIEVESAGATASSSKPLIRPAYAALLAVAVPIFLVALYRSQRGAEEDYWKPAPSLFSKEGAVCPEANPLAAKPQIEGWLRDARGRHERSPFSPRDGVEAVGLYQRAAACLERFDGGTEAATLKLESKALAQRLEKDFHVHRVRLWRALSEKDPSAARREVFILRNYVSAADSEFVAWLDYLDRKSSKGS